MGTRLMPGPASKSNPGSWTIAGAEELIRSLPGIVSVRVVAKPGGDVEEVHVLTTDQVPAKQTVRNVESALLAHFHLTIDHRKVSVAQTAGQKKEELKPQPPPAPAPARPIVQALPRKPAEPEKPSRPGLFAKPDPSLVEPRVIFGGLQIESQRSQQIRHRVEVEWRGDQFRGEATGADVQRARLETVTMATLRAIEAALSKDVGTDLVLGLDGVKTVDAFDRRYVLVAIHAIAGGQMMALSGSALVDESVDKAAILATLQATDRWVRGISR
jgi:hypothetical protein